MSRILIIHTPSQLQEASNLVDLLEASLSLPEGAVVCSSLPGYAWTQQVTGGADTSEALQRFEGLGAALALLDESAFSDPQFWFDLAAAWARGKRVAVLLDAHERRAQLPRELAGSSAIAREDAAALVALIEDVAFDFGLSPRIGQDAQRALAQVSQRPPAMLAGADEVGTQRTQAPTADQTLEHEQARETEQDQESYEAIDTVPPPPLVPRDAQDGDDFEALDDGDEPFELSEDDVEPVQLVSEPRPSHIARVLGCEMSLEAGRALAECSFHRDESADFAAELDGAFGAFIDAAGGDWAALKHLGDIELWLGATDNLLESLPPERRHACEWYEIGFQFSTLCSIGQYGFPADLDQRAAYEDMWDQSMAQLKSSAVNARIAPREIRRLQMLLESMLAPERDRSYENIARALEALREIAIAADRGVQLVVATG